MQNCDVVERTQGLEAALVWCGSADFPTVSFLVFPLVVFSAPRARMFLICSRSFSLSRPSVLPSCRVSTSPADPAAPAAGVKSGKKNPCRHTYFFSSSREKPVLVLFTAVVVVVVTVLLCGPSSWGHLFRIRTASLLTTRTHAHTLTHSHVHARTTNERKRKRGRILFSAYWMMS